MNYDKLRLKINEKSNDSRKIQLLYILDAFLDRRFQYYTEIAILNNFSQIIDSDIDLKKYFEYILIDCFSKESREFHLRIFE